MYPTPPPATGGIFSWSPAEWGVFLGIFATGLSGVLTVVYKFIQNVKVEILEIRSALRTTATEATEAKTASTLNTTAVGNIRRDLTNVAISTPSTEQIANAVSAVVSPTTTPNASFLQKGTLAP